MDSGAALRARAISALGFHQVLLNRRHVRIRCFGILCNGLPRHTKQKTQHDSFTAIAPITIPRIILPPTEISSVCVALTCRPSNAISVRARLINENRFTTQK